MRTISILLAVLSVLSLSSCGGGSTSSTTATSACVSGRLQDSLTALPVSQANIALESVIQLSVQAGVQPPITPVYNFHPMQTGTASSDGSFQVCSTSLANPSALVITAQDSSGRHYPPFIAPITGTTDFGTILMGGCRGMCFESQQQTSAPATISGTITTAPIAKTGSVIPQYAVSALDGSKDANGYPNIWLLAIPSLTSPSFTFTSSACAGSAPFCAPYTFTLPSQRPVQRVNGGYLQESAAPGYAVYASVDGVPAPCSPSSRFTIFQNDGTSLLTGTPGAQLTAQNISFTNCR